jgi:5'-3' exonuclease
MNMEDYFDGPKEKKKILIHDWSNLAHRIIFVAQSDVEKSILDAHQESNPEDIYTFWKIHMVKSILEFNKMFKPDKLVIALDCKWNWRKKIYPDYKGGRDEKRQESKVDFKVFYPIMEEFTQVLKTKFPNVIFHKTDDAEADDSIAILSKEVFKDDEVVIVSTDRDYKQLLQYDHIKVYNPDYRTRDFMNSPNPKEELNLKIVIGDAGDNIPNILVMKGFEKEDERAIGVGEVVAQKILEEGLESDFVLNKVHEKYNEYEGTGKKKKCIKETLTKEMIKEKVKENFQRNLKMISFEQIPVEVKNRIIEDYNKYTLKPINTHEFFNWLIEIECREVVGTFPQYAPHLKKIG